jgi:ribonuclease Z
MVHKVRRGFYVLTGIIVIAAVVIGGGCFALNKKWVQEQLCIIGIKYFLKNRSARLAFVDEPGLKVILCGTSSPSANRERACSCTAVVAGGRIFLVDVGGGSWRNMALWQMPTDRIAGILLTHFHSDHIQDLGEVNMQTWNLGRPGNLAVYGGPGVEHVVTGFGMAYALDQTYRTAHQGKAILPADRYAMIANTIARPDGTSLNEGEKAVVLDDQGLKITAIGVNHFPVKPSYAYRFDYQGRSVVISGDTRASSKLAEAARGCDVLIHEAQQQDLVALMQKEMAFAGEDHLSHIADNIRNFHTSPVEAAEIANQAGAKLLVLTHLSPPLPRFFADPFFLNGVNTVRPKGVKIGYDGLVVNLPQGSKKLVLTDLD